MVKRDFVAVAEVVKPHGLRGEVCIQSHADSPFLFRRGSVLLLERQGLPPRKVEVTGCRRHQGRDLLSLDGVADRDDAEALRGAVLSVPRAHLPEPEDGGVYLHDLVGAQVFLPDGLPLGVLESFLFTPAGETWIIRAPDGREVLFPAVPRFVLQIDATARRVEVDPPPGLLELYLGPAE